MSLNTMAQRMLLEIPGISSAYARTLLNEALGHIEDEIMWSFQLQTSGWLTPGLLFPQGSGGPALSVGTITATPFSDQIVGDANATAAWQAYVAAGNSPVLTQTQIRSPYYSLYNIIDYDLVSTFTLDRPWMEPGGANLGYMIYQAYFAVPVTATQSGGDPNFRRFLWARDTTNSAPMDYWTMDQKMLAVKDPERTIFDDPGYFVPYQIDNRPGSSTLGSMLYELWPHPLSVLPYTYGYLFRGPELQQPADTVPFPITEDLVLWQAKTSGYLWKEAQKGENIERGSGADYKFLAQACSAKYASKLKEIKAADRGMVDLYFSKWNPDYYNSGEPYSTVNGMLNVGRW